MNHAANGQSTIQACLIAFKVKVDCTVSIQMGGRNPKSLDRVKIGTSDSFRIVEGCV